MKYENSKKHKKDRDRLLKKTSAVVQDLLNLISIYIKQTNDINYYRLKRGSLCNAYKADSKRKR